MEAASVLSGRAKSQKTVRLTIILSLLIVLAVYMLITFIAMSSVPAEELAASDTPLALVLSRTAIGAAGGIIIKLGIMVSVLGASLSWILLSVETLYAAAQDGVLPRTFRKVNRKGTPVNALLLTQCFTQLFLLSILSPQLNETYLAAITIATTLVLIPYLLSSLYAVKIALSLRKKESAPPSCDCVAWHPLFSLRNLRCGHQIPCLIDTLLWHWIVVVHPSKKGTKKTAQALGMGCHHYFTDRIGHYCQLDAEWED